MLVPMDFSPASEDALRWAVDLVRTVGGAVEALHVVPPIHQLDSFFRPGLTPKQSVAAIRRRAEQRLASLCRRRRIACGLQVVEGDPATRILEIAARRKPDLIAVGTRARRGSARCFLGSVAERVIRAAPVPVLTVRCRR